MVHLHLLARPVHGPGPHWRCPTGSLRSALVLRESTCVLCGAASPVVCPRCEGALGPAPSLAVPRGLDACWALLAYEPARPLVVALKNRNRRDLVTWLADRLAGLGRPDPASVITWAPTGSPRRRARGYDHAELLARALARRWHAPCVPLLTRAPGPAQAGRAAAERRVNPAFAVHVRRAMPPTVVVVDDVVTTGATLTAAATALHRAGVESVTAAVAARASSPRWAS